MAFSAPKPLFHTLLAPKQFKYHRLPPATNLRYDFCLWISQLLVLDGEQSCCQQLHKATLLFCVSASALRMNTAEVLRKMEDDSGKAAMVNLSAMELPGPWQQSHGGAIPAAFWKAAARPINVQRLYAAPAPKPAPPRVPLRPKQPPRQSVATAADVIDVDEPLTASPLNVRPKKQAGPPAPSSKPKITLQQSVAEPPTLGSALNLPYIQPPSGYGRLTIGIHVK